MKFWKPLRVDEPLDTRPDRDLAEPAANETKTIGESDIA